MRPVDPATVDRLAVLLRDGATDAAAARAVGINKTTAGEYRRRLGIAPAPKQPAATRSRLTLAEKWQTYTRTVEGGHVEWTGRRRKTTGTFVFTHLSREYTARAVAFRIATGRTPVGTVTTECDHPEWCVAPAHVADEPTRTRLRAAYAAVIGRVSHATECTNGHPAATHRRYDRDGGAYCAACHAAAATARKTASSEQAAA